MVDFLIKNIEVQNPFVESFVTDILISNNKIVKIADNISADAKIVDGKDKIITPGLIDRHTHGGYGCNFNTCNEDELQNYLINAKKHGITQVLPTIMTDSIDNINRQINLIKNIHSKGAKIIGVHLEGPFINPNKKGIHPEKYILPLRKNSLEKIDLSFVKVMTFAPEMDNTGEFLKELLKRKIIPSIGHSDCKYDLALEIIKQDVTQITHIFNAIRPIHHREPGVLTAALNNNNVATEIIMDLEHVNKAIIEILLKLKPKEKILLITDALPVSYSSKTEDIFGEEKIYVNSNKAISADGTLAGSTLFFDDIYKRIKDFIPFKDFVGFASQNIATSLKMNDWLPIAENCEDFIFWNKKNFNIIHIQNI